MMNTEIKRHIDAARQVLVGVVPNPTSQIDQITNALIYKFMDDMDQASIKAGGNATFFVGDLETYAWTRLMDARIGNQERMNLYSEALIKFSQATQLPELFRGIFKSAFLPYRSPETLGLFLKEINYFDYSHSEELGNAYEYLLSIMSSQGDAGQFRTPRHIIDFIVAVVGPTKDDKVLDPACGTGGFLVSSYKYILGQHDSKNNPKEKIKLLTPDERKKLMNNFEGYDIDPTMVRIAQVNMYLHQFKNPKIFQYDSLSNEERWKEKFDIILANPPFMSPKGGIKPHNKFSIQSSRSEVLFVDYIMNHLRPKGRAGVIVPEGIIFQSQKAHKQLRKNLIKDGLYAVVSLPSGIFQPYSGVKTSILFFDNELAKTKHEILFIKITNDGFDLGATKRQIDKNDLPIALEVLSKWHGGEKVEHNLALYVEKTRIAENDDYNLSGDRYRVVNDYSNTKWPMVELGTLEKEGKIKFLRGQGLSKGDIKKDGKTKCIHYGEIYIIYEPIIRSVVSRTNYEGKVFSEKGDVLVPATTTADALGIAVARSLNESGVILGSDINIIRTRNHYILSDYLAYLISNSPLKIELANFAKGANILHLSNSDLRQLTIPLPPLEIQEQIVAELDGYSAIIDGAKQIAKNWKPKIDIDPKWEKVKMKNIVNNSQQNIVDGPFGSNLKSSEYIDTGVPIIRLQNVKRNLFIDKNLKFISENKAMQLRRHDYKAGDIVLTKLGDPLGEACIVPDTMLPGIIVADIVRIRINEEAADTKFIVNMINSNMVVKYLRSLTKGATRSRINLCHIRNIEIPLPPLETQKQIVKKIEAERELVESAKKLIEIYEQKTKETISKIWNT
jgi:type I restriction enzyme M protein